MTTDLFEAISAYHERPSETGRRRVGDLVARGHLTAREASILSSALRRESAWGLRWPWRSGR